MLPLSILRSAADWTFWFVSFLDNMFRKHSDPDFEQIYLFSPSDLFSACTFLHLTRQLWTNTLYSLVIRTKLRELGYSFLHSTSVSPTNVSITMSQTHATVTSSSLTSLTGRDFSGCCWGLWLEWRRPEGNTTGESGSPQVFLHTGVPRGA